MARARTGHRRPRPIHSRPPAPLTPHPRRDDPYLTLRRALLLAQKPTADNSEHRKEQEQQEQRDLDLPSAAALLDSLAPRLRALLAQNPLRVQLGGLNIMQPDPARAHVLYVEPDMRSPDDRCLRGLWCVLLFNFFFWNENPISYPHPPVSFPLERTYVPLIGSDFFFRASSWCFHGSWLSL